MKWALRVTALVLAAFSVQTAAVARPPERSSIQFAGLKTAVQCLPGAIRPGERSPVFLSWSAASGGGTPKSQFVYEIFMSRTPGGENFASPNWTTEGQLSFQTPKLPPNRYFVVRARDRFGHQDHNTVERVARNPCV